MPFPRRTIPQSRSVPAIMHPETQKGGSPNFQVSTLICDPAARRNQGGVRRGPPKTGFISSSIMITTSHFSPRWVLGSYLSPGRAGLWRWFPHSLVRFGTPLQGFPRRRGMDPEPGRGCERSFASGGRSGAV